MEEPFFVETMVSLVGRAISSNGLGVAMPWEGELKLLKAVAEKALLVIEKLVATMKSG